MGLADYARITPSSPWYCTGGVFREQARYSFIELFALNTMEVVGMSERGKAMSDPERGELAGRIAAESGDAIAKATKNGMFVLPLATNIATANV
jgi:hypothetical protein